MGTAELDARAAATTVPLDPGSTDAATLPSGTVLGGRYRIQRFIARGGMGAVYAARDQELGVTVAVKLLRSDAAWSDAAVARLKRETQLARAVTHPGVCRTFDLGVHRAPGQPELHFVTMELLSGRTLADRLHHGGCSEVEARTIVRAICSALDAAHEAKIVHRDLKPSNVMLIEQAGRPPRVVITDFGLARGFGDGDGVDGDGAAVARRSAGATAGGAATGATAGGAASGATAGGAASGATAGGAASGATAGGAAAGGTQGGAAAGATVGAVSGDAATESPMAGPNTAIAGTPDYMSPEQLVGGHLGPATDVHALGVLMHEVIAGRLPWRSADSIAAARDRRAEPAADLPAPWAELIGRALDRDPAARPTCAEIAAALAPGGDRSARSAALAPGGDRSARGAAGDTDDDRSARGDTDGDRSPRGDTDGDRSARGARRWTAIAIAAAAAGATAAAAWLAIARPWSHGAPARRPYLTPRTPPAALVYAVGAAFLRAGEASDGVPLLERVVAAEPDFALGHSDLSAGLLELGYVTRATAESTRALAMTAGLPRASELVIEARAHEAAGAWTRAAETYALLATLVPGDRVYPRARIRAVASGGELAAARAQVATLLATDQSIPVLILAAELAQRAGDHAAAADAARRALAAAEHAGAHLSAARALAVLGEAQADLGDDGFAASFDAALAHLQAVGGDRSAEARLVYMRARALVPRDPAQARTRFETALARFRELGDRVDEASTLDALGTLDASAHPEDARRFHQQALAIQQEVGDRRGAMVTLLNLGGDAMRADDAIGAAELWNRALAEARQLGDRHLIGSISYNLGTLAEQRDDLIAARRFYDEAVAALQAIAAPELAYARVGQGNVALAQAEWEQARHAYDSVATTPGADPTQRALAGLGLAQIAFERGDHARAAGDADRIAAELAAMSELDLAISAYGIAARAWVGAHDGKRGAASAAAAAALIDRTEVAASRLTAAVAQATVAEPDDPRAAIAILDDAARRLGVELTSQARLVLGKAQLDANQTAAGRDTLRTLARDETARGSVAIARRAAGLLDGSERVP